VSDVCVRGCLLAGVVDEDVDGARFTLLENTDKFRRSVSQLDKSAECVLPALPCPALL
jgi:hypothetical protein